MEPEAKPSMNQLGGLTVLTRMKEEFTRWQEKFNLDERVFAGFLSSSNAQEVQDAVVTSVKLLIN